VPDSQLSRYQAKRDFSATPEPAGDGAAAARGAGHDGRFVVQEHHATRLHWDLRLEHEGALASWAVPNGIPPDRSENRLAVRTEDHPLQYLEFHGEIPKGNYGAGTMTIWDAGTYELHKWEERKVEVTFHGERLQGRYGLFPIGREPGDKDWMIHRMDAPTDPDREPMPDGLVPMLARAGTLPPDESRWSFEVKWDGVRALAYAQPGRLRLESRAGNEITDAYPELRALVNELGMREAVLDGEIVAFDEQGRPSFERLQKRMHVTSPASIRRLAVSTPVIFAAFDLLYLDGHSLMARPYAERRAALEALGEGARGWRVPAAHPGRGEQLLDATRQQGLEGIVAKRLDSRYESGRRTGAWIKIKNTRRQELVIGGWLPGEGRRTDRIGALLMGYYDGDAFRYAGRVGTGFTEKTLSQLAATLRPLRQDANPYDGAPKLPREAVFVAPSVVAEVEFTEWTREGVMRAPSYKGVREDKDAREVVREDAGVPQAPAGDADPEVPAPDTPEALFDDVSSQPDGALSVACDGRRLKLSNWDKVLFPQAGFTKGDLIAYYARVAPAVLPHLHDRALTLKRYPSGVDAQYFYEKQSPSHRPAFVDTARVGDVDYTLAQDRPTLVWLANLADVELHTSLSLAHAPQRPTMMVFDLDPGAPAGLLECAEVALVLRGLFEQLRLQCAVKTSGSKGLQVYVPLNGEVGYEQTKPFARRVAELLEGRLPELVVSRMTKRLRAGKVLVDWSQNDVHKTTVTVYSVRARERPTVSTPLRWEEVQRARSEGDPSQLSFETDQVLARVAQYGDLFAPVLDVVQALPAVS
jgi:bifunctional non-homologous end joining protein LigD